MIEHRTLVYPLSITKSLLLSYYGQQLFNEHTPTIITLLTCAHMQFVGLISKVTFSTCFRFDGLILFIMCGFDECNYDFIPVHKLWTQYLRTPGLCHRVMILNMLMDELWWVIKCDFLHYFRRVKNLHRKALLLSQGTIIKCNFPITSQLEAIRNAMLPLYTMWFTQFGFFSFPSMWLSCLVFNYGKRNLLTIYNVSHIAHEEKNNL